MMIAVARGSSISLSAAMAASARPGLVRAIRPNWTMPSGSAMPTLAAIIASVGFSRSRRNNSGRASTRPMCPSAQAAALATAPSRSARRSTSRAITRGRGWALQQASARIAHRRDRRDAGDAELLRQKRGVLPDVEMIRMDQINEAFDRLDRSDVRYRFVIDMASLHAAA